MKKYISIATAVLITISTFAREEQGKAPSPQNSGTSGVDCARSSSSAELDINNVRAFILNGGDMWYDQPGSGAARYEIPKLNDPDQIKKNSMFAGSVWIGGEDLSTGNVLVTAQTYRQGHYAYWPGPLVANDTIPTEMPIIEASECSFWNKHFKINKSEIEQFKQDFGDGNITIVTDIPDVILNWPSKNNPYIDKTEGSTTVDFDRNLAPFVDVGGPESPNEPDGNYDPFYGDYPSILGDQTIWWVMNDMGNLKEFGNLVQSSDDGIGLELETRAFAFQTNDAINDMTFYEQILYNKGNKTLVNTYVGQWVDPDLGNYVDDYVGCDVERGLGICYNGDDDDEGVLGYGLNPPAIGVDFFEGPLADMSDGADNDRDGLVDEGSDGIDNDGFGGIDDEGEREKIVMSNFLYYNNNTDPINGNPANKLVFYNYLRNIWGTGESVMYDGADGTDQSVNLKANFMFPGSTDQEFYWGTNGTAVTPWDEVSAGNAPADRRFLQSAGPFTLEPGQQNTITIGVVWCRAGSGGATGSIACLKAADDKAQELFDRKFKDFNGPNPPEVDVTELDQEVVLAFSPSTFIVDDIEMNTESYDEIDNGLLVAGADDPTYSFQGYLIYQLKDETVSGGDLENNDQARLIAQCDKQDGVSSLVNYFNDGGVAGNVATEKVDGSDEGIFHTISIKSDAFNSGKELYNNKEYYFIIIAYAGNVDPLNVDRQGDEYIGSKKNIERVVAIPHQSGFGNDAVVTAATYGTGIDITAVNGIGTGSNSLDINEETRDIIFNNDSIEMPTYQGGNAPLDVQVYDPYKVKAGNFKVKLYSRLVFDLDESSSFEIGEKIETQDATTNADLAPSEFDFHSENAQGYIMEFVDTFQMEVDTTIISYVPAIVDSIVIDYNGTGDTIIVPVPEILVTEITDTTVTIDTTVNPADTTITYILDTLTFILAHNDTDIVSISVLNEPADTLETVSQLSKTVVEAKVVITNNVAYGDEGTFAKHLVNIETIPDFSDPNNPTTTDVFTGYSDLLLDFTSLDNTGKMGRTYGFQLNEYFELEDGSGNVIDKDKHYRVSEYTEVLLREYGITMKMQHGYDPEFEKCDRNDNGFIEATFNVTEGADWLRTIDRPEDLEEPYWQSLSPVDKGVTLTGTTVDPAGVYNRVANGAIAPYNTSRDIKKDASDDEASDGGAKYVGAPSKYSYQDLPNIDVIITSDESKWTRVPVLQADFREAGVNNPSYLHNKSNVLSVGTDGQPDGTTSPVSGFGASKGMGWFPGYAIDIDKGIRLNMMFTESRRKDKENGNNLKWEPTSDDDGGRSFVYILGTKYDPSSLEVLMDDAELNSYDNASNFGKAFAEVFKDVTWVMNLKKSKSQAILAGSYKIRVRVNHYFVSDNDNNPIPEYTFSTDEYVPTDASDSLLSTLCDNFRVVPNPYYAYSEYENGQLDNRVRLTNLPLICKISILTLSGTMVKFFDKDDSSTYLDWNLLNEKGSHVASGTYLIHIEAPGVCEKVVKFFGIIRPLDLDTF